VLNSGSILIADDEPAICTLLARVLTGAGYAVDLASDGYEAVRRFEAAHYDAAIIDVIMPNKEGIETMIEVKRRWPGCKVIAMSGGGRIGAEQFLDLARAFGVDSTLAKPFRPAAVVGALQSLLARNPEPA
jgi:DNA-binding response OmpR family regulator